MNVIQGRNAVIDGWRGLSVSLVIVGHFIGYRLPSIFPTEALNGLGLSLGDRTFDIIASLGGLGVNFFFVISGFLITSLMIAEERKHDRFNIGAFYVRRVFRIMPAFYFYVFAIFLLDLFDLIRVSDGALARSSAYVCNFSGFSCNWWLAHTWSLAVEEQFYLSWPLLFLLSSSRHRWTIAAGLFAGFTIGSLFVSELGSFAYIVLGVLVAQWPAAQQRFARLNGLAIWIALTILLVSPVLQRIEIVSTVLPIVQPLLVAIAFFGTVLGPERGMLRWILQLPLLTRIGLVSYSLYLWQQLSLSPVQWNGQVTGANVLQAVFDPLLVVAFVPLAIASYFCLEKPLVKIGHRISRRMIERGSRAGEKNAGPQASVL